MKKLDLGLDVGVTVRVSRSVVLEPFHLVTVNNKYPSHTTARWRVNYLKKLKDASSTSSSSDLVKLLSAMHLCTK